MHSRYELLRRYASAAFIVVDNEGRMAEHIATIPEATLPTENVLLASGSLEEDNFDAQELIDAACHLAANPPEGRTAVALTLTAEMLLASHAEQRRSDMDEVLTDRQPRNEGSGWAFRQRRRRNRPR